MGEPTVAVLPLVNREQWLTAAVEEFRQYYTKCKFDIPPLRVSCGFPSKGALSKNRVLGECWNSDTTFDGIRHLFVSPLLSDPLDVLGVLAHELLHACLPDDTKHGPKFKEAMKVLGLEGKASSAMPGPQMMPVVERVADALGDYSNPALKPKEKKDRAASAKKSFKMFCPDKRNCTKKCLLLDKAIGKDYNTTTGKKSLSLGFPQCPCGQEMEMEPDDYKLYLDLDK